MDSILWCIVLFCFVFNLGSTAFTLVSNSLHSFYIHRKQVVQSGKTQAVSQLIWDSY